jgi:hypothetical protein
MSQLEHQLPLSAVDEAPAVTPLAEQEISVEVLVEKYAKGKETSVHDVRRRVARALAANEDEKQRAHWEERFLWAQETGFVPAGRINSAAGHDAGGNADQLLRAADRRFGGRDRRWQAGHLQRTRRSRRNHASRRRRRL